MDNCRALAFEREQDILDDWYWVLTDAIGTFPSMEDAIVAMDPFQREECDDIVENIDREKPSTGDSGELV